MWDYVNIEFTYVPLHVELYLWMSGAIDSNLGRRLLMNECRYGTFSKLKKKQGSFTN